jgi:hypothetical protein
MDDKYSIYGIFVSQRKNNTYYVKIPIISVVYLYIQFIRYLSTMVAEGSQYDIKIAGNMANTLARGLPNMCALHSSGFGVAQEQSNSFNSIIIVGLKIVCSLGLPPILDLEI